MLLTLIRKDFVRRWRSPASSLVMVAFPFLMAGMIGMVSGGGGSQQVPDIDVLIVDLEDGFLGGFLTNGQPSESSEVPLNLIAADLDEGRRLMEAGEASAMLVIPENFTEDLLDGSEVTLQLVRNPAEGIKPEIVEQGVEVLATYLDVAVKTLGDELLQIKGMFDAKEMPSVVLVTTLAGEFFQKSAKAKLYVFPPVMAIESVKEEDGSDPINVFGYILVMVSVMSVLFVAIRAVTDLYEDRRTGMLRRQLSTPLPVALLVMAKIVFAVLFSMVVMAILLAVGGALGWFSGQVNFFGLVLHTAAFAMAAAGMMTIIVALTQTEKQAGILSWIVVMVMSAVGGSMFPASELPAAIRPITHATLNYWAVEGYLDLLVTGGGLSAAWFKIGLLAGMGVVFVFAGQLLMQRRFREGAL